MASFEELFVTLKDRSQSRPAGSRTVELLDQGTHAIGKKIVEEASEVWMAAEHEGIERTAQEIAQLIYHIQVLMIDQGISMEDIEAEL
ncbi:MAG: phosphoribosyl-ATP diphosphatase [Actinomycetota bacterium]